IVLCTRGFESHPRCEGPSRACVVFLKRAYEAILGTTSPVSSSLPTIHSLSGGVAVFPSGSIAHPLCDEVAEWLRRCTANPFCSAGVGSKPIIVGKAPTGLVLSFSNEHSRGGHFRDYITSVHLLTFPFWMSGCISIWLYSASSM